MTLAQIKSWVEVNSDDTRVSSIKSEIMLIEFYQKSKHDHFSPKGLRKLFDEMKKLENPPLKVGMMAVNKTTGNKMILDPEEDGDLFFFVLSHQVSKKDFIDRERFIRTFFTDDNYIDDNNQCEHDREMNSKIALSIEYIVGLINR